MHQNGHHSESMGRGYLTFMENELTTNVGTIIPMVKTFSLFIKVFRLFETMLARASIMLERMFERFSVWFKHWEVSI